MNIAIMKQKNTKLVRNSKLDVVVDTIMLA